MKTELGYQLTANIQTSASVRDIVAALQECYELGSVAGSFNVVKTDDFYRITFDRDLDADMEILNILTPTNSREQLAREFADVEPNGIPGLVIAAMRDTSQLGGFRVLYWEDVNRSDAP